MFFYLGMVLINWECDWDNWINLQWVLQVKGWAIIAQKIQLTYWKCFTLMMLAVQDQENQIIIILVWPHYSISILSTCPFSKVNLWAAMSLYLQEHSSWHRFQHHPFITSTVSTRMPVSVSSILLFQHTSVCWKSCRQRGCQMQFLCPTCYIYLLQLLGPGCQIFLHPHNWPFSWVAFSLDKT